MHNTIHIETNPINSSQFELIQTWVTDDKNLDERYYLEKHDDRMAAAIVNVGKAARWFVDEKISRGAVCIISDRDGKDTRYAGEHDTLFEAIVSRDDYQKNRLSYGLLYGSHVARLDRIREYADANEITFTQNAKPLQDIVFHGKEIKPDYIPSGTFSRAFWNKDNLTVINLNGNRNRITCRLCGSSAMFQQSDSFCTFSAWSEKTNRNRLIKNNKAFIAFFLETHLWRHGLDDN